MDAQIVVLEKLANLLAQIESTLAKMNSKLTKISENLERISYCSDGSSLNVRKIN